jgi:ribosome-binding protein aMBF1 (putative translation factor)
MPTAQSAHSSNPAADVPVTSEPVGGRLADHGATDPVERSELERLAAFEELARLVIMRRAQLGLSQADLARRMNSSQSVVSRIESGQHPTNTATLKKIAEALEGRAVVGFQFGTASIDDPTVVSL